MFHPDTIPPNATYCLASDNTLDTSLAKAGDVVTVSVTGTEGLRVPTVTCNGVVFSVAGSPGDTTFDATYEIDVSDTALDGVTLSCTVDVIDVAGNMATSVTEEVGSCDVTVDLTAPDLTYCVLSDNTFDSDYGVEGSELTIEMEASESVVVPVVTCNSQSMSVSVVPASGGTEYVGTRTVGAAENGAVSCMVTFTDLAGNVGTAMANVTTSCDVILGKWRVLLR